MRRGRVGGGEEDEKSKEAGTMRRRSGKRMRRVKRS